jgi:hypothetical protein
MTVLEFIKQSQARLHGTEWTDESCKRFKFVADELESVGFVLSDVKVTRKAEDNSVVDCIKKYSLSTDPKKFVNIGRRQGKQFVSYNVR